MKSAADQRRIGSNVPTDRKLRPGAPSCTPTSTTSTPGWKNGATATRPCATPEASTRETTTVTASARCTSTRWRACGPYCAPGSGRTAASRRRSCLPTSPSSRSSTTRAGGERPFSPRSSGRSSREPRSTPRIPRRANKVWVWRAYDPVARRTLAWELGGRDDATCRRLLEKVGVGGNVFLTDDWEGFHRLIPEEQLFTGKDLTVPIEQDNSEVRHHLARFRRRSKVTSRARHMVDGALRLLCHLRQPENFLPMRDSFLSLFR